MGYRTYYTLTDDDAIIDHVGALAKELDVSTCELEGGEEMKWYEHVDDMINYSKKYPHVTFRLDGVGEESTDVWVRWFKDGVF